MTGHAVYFYEDDAFLIDNVARFVKTGLERDETVIVVATEEHRIDLKARLMDDNAIGLSSPTDARYQTLDAASTLSLFMLDGWPNERLFLKVIGQIIASTARETPVRIYGEMVAVLWAQGKQRAAIRLEELWNTLARQQAFSLLCGYPASTFDQPALASALEEVCACHSQVTGRRSSPMG
ncbi:MAG TPA: MEDS domain-containing protein [Nitrospira sp.]|nr:MEDS domain-containing protein [Nitrospira sp.]